MSSKIEKVGKIMCPHALFLQARSQMLKGYRAQLFDPDLPDTAPCTEMYAYIYSIPTVCRMMYFVISDSEDMFGQTPLCIAAYHGHEAIVEFLIRAGANINGKFSDANNYDDNWKV